MLSCSSGHFCLYQPSIAVLRRILDKKLFADAAIKAGLAVLPSWDPRNVDEVAALAPRLAPIRSSSSLARMSTACRNDKGIVVHSAAELISQYRRFVDRERDRGPMTPLLPDASLPILQQFVRVGSEGVHSVTGFIDRTGELFVTRWRNQGISTISTRRSWRLLRIAAACSRTVGCRSPPLPESLVISVFLRSNFSGSMGVGRQSISIRACLIRLAWTSAEVCRFRFSPILMPRGQTARCAMRLRKHRRRTMVKLSFTTGSRCARYFSPRPSRDGYRVRIVRIGATG